MVSKVTDTITPPTTASTTKMVQPEVKKRTKSEIALSEDLEAQVIAKKGSFFDRIVEIVENLPSHTEYDEAGLTI